MYGTSYLIREKYRITVNAKMLKRNNLLLNWQYNIAKEQFQKTTNPFCKNKTKKNTFDRFLMSYNHIEYIWKNLRKLSVECGHSYLAYTCFRAAQFWPK